MPESHSTWLHTSEGFHQHMGAGRRAELKSIQDITNITAEQHVLAAQPTDLCTCGRSYRCKPHLGHRAESSALTVQSHKIGFQNKIM